MYTYVQSCMDAWDDVTVESSQIVSQFHVRITQLAVRDKGKMEELELCWRTRESYATMIWWFFRLSSTRRIPCTIIKREVMGTIFSLKLESDILVRVLSGYCSGIATYLYLFYVWSLNIWLYDYLLIMNRILLNPISSLHRYSHLLSPHILFHHDRHSSHPPCLTIVVYIRYTALHLQHHHHHLTLTTFFSAPCVAKI